MNVKTNVGWLSFFVKFDNFQKQLSTTKYQRFFLLKFDFSLKK